MRLQRHLERTDESLLLSAAAIKLIYEQLQELLVNYKIYVKNYIKRDKKTEKTFKHFLKKNKLPFKDIRIYSLNDEDNPNAFVLPNGELVLSSRLKELLKPEELWAFLLHEYGHHYNKDFIAHSVRKYSFILLALAVATAASSTWISLFIFFLLYKTGTILNSIMAKQMEYKADSMAVKLGYGKELSVGMAKLQVLREMYGVGDSKITKIIDKLSDLIDEHPAIESRIKRILGSSDVLDLMRKEVTWVDNEGQERKGV